MKKNVKEFWKEIAKGAAIASVIGVGSRYALKKYDEHNIDKMLAVMEGGPLPLPHDAMKMMDTIQRHISIYEGAMSNKQKCKEFVSRFCRILDRMVSKGMLSRADADRRYERTIALSQTSFSHMTNNIKMARKISYDIYTRRFSEEEKPSFWKRHKGKIIAGATVAALGGLGYLNKDKVLDAYDYIKDKAHDAYDYTKDKARDAYGTIKDKARDAYGTVRYKVFMDKDDFVRNAKEAVTSSWSVDNLESKADNLANCVQYLKYHGNDGDDSTLKSLVKRGIDKGADFCEKMLDSDISKDAKDSVRKAYHKLKNLASDF